jgi:hypothetical protein
MADHNDKNKTGRTVAVVGGGALLLLLLLRGKGWGLGDGRGEGDGDAKAAAGATPDRPARPTRCRVRIDADGIELDGSPADLATVTERCRAAGEADVRATGAAITGVVAQVIQALQAAGVRVWASAGLWDTAAVTPSRRSP